MPSYRFTGAYPRVLVGLSEGVNAHHEGTPYGATIQPAPGDLVQTDAPYTHPELEPVDGPEALVAGLAAVSAAADAGAAGIDVLREAAAQAAPAEPITLTADEVAHLAPEVLAQIHAAEETPDSAPAPETQE